MEPQRWEHIQSVFGVVADLPPDQKNQALHKLCEGDRTLISRVLDLLHEDQNQQTLLDANGDELISRMAEASLSSDHLRSLVQRQIGPYRLLRVLGEGGMGVVYLGERIDIGGLVAIKLLRDAWLSPMRRQRFLLEQQTLVKLNHPSIARIYDASAMDDGTPWFVMEYVDGLPITEFLRKRNGTLRDDLKVFQQVCQAVQYAHSHAVIHRDLKPSNILATSAAEVKLLDFGIAKQIDAAAAQTTRTLDGLRLLTPGYAAPEQSSGGSIGIFTDVYSLGVLLYEILTGQLPSTNASQDGKPIRKPSTLARTPGTLPSRLELSRRQWADLDVLCLTALEPEPERRYRSADALSRDITAYLEGYVLEARPHRFPDRAAKFARRNRLPLLTLAVAISVLAGSAVLFTVRLAHARDAALAEAARTQRIQHYTENLFAGGDTDAGPSTDMKVAELLDRGQTEAESLGQDPRMQADMLATLGGVYQKLGRLDKAESLFQKAMALRRQALEPNDPQYAASLIALGLLRRDQRRMEDAEKFLRQGLALELQAPHKDGPAIEHSLWALGSVLSLHGNYAEAKKLLEAALRQGSHAGAPSAQLADDYTQLGDVDFYTGDYNASKDLNERALAINEKLLGERHPAVADNLSTLGEIAKNQTQYELAESYLRRALAIDEAWYGPDHPKIAGDLTALAGPLTVRKQYAQAQSLLQRALSIQQHVHGPSHPGVAMAFNELGVLASSRDLNDEAEKDFRAALAIWRNAYGEHHQFVGLSYANLAGVYLQRKDYAQAEAMCRKALQVYNSSLSADNINTASLHVKLGRVLLRQHRYAEAERETLLGYRFLSAHVGPRDSYLLAARKDLAEAENQMSKPE